MIKITLITLLSVQVLILSVLLFVKKENRLTNSLLGFVLILFGLTTINFSLFQALVQEHLIKYIPYLRLELLYALGPSIYVYTLAVTDTEFKLKRTHILLFLPGLMEFVYYRTSYYRIAVNPTESDSSDFWVFLFHVHQWIGVIYSTFFMCASIYLLFKYRNWLYDNYSYTKNVSLKWLQVPIVCFVVFWFVWFTIRLTDLLLFSGNYGYIYYYPMYIVLSLIALWIGFKGFINSKTKAVGFKGTLKHKEKKEKKDFSEYEIIAKSILDKMESEKYYLRQDLSLKMLSEKTGVQKDLLSKIINQNFGVNFHEFINRYRVKDFIKRIEMDKTREFTFLSHAYDSGFASKSSFNSVFKKQTNKTPKEYFSGL